MSIINSINIKKMKTKHYEMPDIQAVMWGGVTNICDTSPASKSTGAESVTENKSYTPNWQNYYPQ